MHFRHLAALSLLAVMLPVRAADNIDSLGSLSQSDFRLLSEDLGAALSYKPLTPAEPTGVLGFDLGVEVTATRLAHSEVFDRAVSGGAPDTLLVPKLHLHKGLPFGIDIGASYAAVPNSNIKLLGAEVRYALLQGGIATPAVGLRASYSTMRGVSQLDLDTTGVDLSISKGFAFFTPYAGVGLVRVSSTPNDVPNLRKTSFTDNKYFVGANFNFLLMNIAVEADRTGDTTSYGAKLGWRF
ncbi:hypothetical protein [Noviherbaspirillum massiliense]|uniref:hypothetical protein n=1 Tax=Noviherbaspirillum massiliense TaxID=1465823 RepID=UPI0002F350D4|nr:hypothetical protein [Noviherbaspirillum massiliense]